MAVQLHRTARTGVVAPPPPVVGVQHVVGAAVDYSGYPGVTAGTFQADLALLESRIRTVLGVTGLQFAGPHGYSGNTWPAIFSSTAVSWAPGLGYGYSFLNTKTGGSPSYSSWAGWAAGDWDAHCTTYINSVPDGHTHVFTTDHEGENDKGGTYGGPDADGGVWEATYADQHARGTARMANIVAAINRPNVFYAYVPMGVTFPSNGQLGSLGIHLRDPEKWNPYKYMTAEARARTILAPDVYTHTTNSSGSYTTLASEYDRVINYNSDAGWGAQKFGIFEHTIDNDLLASDAAVAAIWQNDIFAYLAALGDRLACYLVFSEATGFASGGHGWVDDVVNGTQPYTAKVTQFGTMTRTLNFGAAPTGGGITFRTSSTAGANNATPSVLIPAAAQVGDYCLIKFGCTATVTLTETAITAAGWTVHVAQDSGNERARWYGKKLASGEPGSTFTGPGMSASSRWEMETDVYSGQNATTPLDGAVGVASDTLAQTTHATGSATSTDTGRMVVTAVWNRGTTLVNTAVWGPPAGYTGRSSSYPAGLPGSSGATADLANQGAGTYGPLTWTSDAAVGSFVGAVLILKP